MVKRFLIFLYCSLACVFASEACTSAVVGAKAAHYGRPMLWKHRDTSNIDNKVEYVAAKGDDHGYVALFNSQDTKLKEAWTGMNDAGFAIMNTASYNIKDDNVPASKMDREGLLMTLALKTCVTVDDFEKLLTSYRKPFGVEANFGVIDAYGNGAVFETNNHSFKRFDLSEAPSDIIIRTNYSHSGRPGEGYGFIREANAIHLLSPLAERKEITPEYLTEIASRSFWHDMMKKDLSEGPDRWVIDQDFIPRYKSTATIVIEGCEPLAPGEKPDPDLIRKQYIMWTGLGYPPCADIYPVYCSPDGVPVELRGSGANGHSPQCDIVKKRRDEVFPIKKGNGEKYIDMSKLFNSDGTGYVQKLREKNLEMYKNIRNKRVGK